MSVALKKNYSQDPERAFLVGLKLPGQTRWEADDSLEELTNLTYSAGANFIGSARQEIRKIDPAFFIGRGKADELAQAAREARADVVIFDEELSATQNRNLEEKLNLKVVDRPGLILDIFAQRARTKEGKLQVELAQCLYLLPRLVGQWGHFSRQTGGIGTRGPGETQLEVDRRRIREKISHIRRELERVRSAREIHRARRLSIPIPTISLVGYTNAGKSTLMKALTQAEVIVEDKLFATLDPTVRRLKLPSGREVLLTDTVGFIRRIPHALVESFKATFEEIRGSDLLIHVVDSSHPSRLEQIGMVNKVLKELSLDSKCVLEVYNKVDLMGPNYQEEKGKIFVSALKSRNLNAVLSSLDDCLSRDFKRVKIQVPHQEGALVAFLHRYGRVREREYLDHGVKLTVDVYEKYLPQLKPYRATAARK